MFNSFEWFSNYVLNQLDIPGSSLGTINQFLKDKLKDLKSVIETPKDEWLWFRAIMQPRIKRKTEDGSLLELADDEVAVSKSRFDKMKDKALKVWDDYYIVTYRNPVPNTENMTINKLVIDHSMVSEEDIALSPWNVFVNKQADYDGDHLNVVYINNQQSDSKQYGWLWIALWTIFNIQDTMWVMDDWYKSLINRIYNEDNARWLVDDITKYVSDWIKNQWEEWIPQTRVPVSQVDAAWEWVPAENIIQASTNAITGKDNIGIVDSFIRTIDLIRKYGWEYNNAELIWTTKDKVERQFKEDLSFWLNNIKKRIWELEAKENKTIEDEAKLESLITTTNNIEEAIEQMVSQLPNVNINPDYKSLAAWIEQMTLDLAKAWLSELPEWWAEDLLETVFPWANFNWIKEIFWPIQSNTSKVYDNIWDSNVLNYWTEYSQETKAYEFVDLPVLWQHRALYNKLSKAIEYIRNELSSISNVKADKEFYKWFYEWENWLLYKKVATIQNSYNVHPTLQTLIQNEKAANWPYISHAYQTYIPWLEKVKWADGKYRHSVSDPELLESYLIDNPLPGVTKEWVTLQ